MIRLRRPLHEGVIQITVLLATALLSACGVRQTVVEFFGGEDNITPPAPLVEFTPRIEVIRLWDTNIGKGTRDLYLKLTPAVTSERVYTAAADGTVSAISSTGGNRLWAQDLDVRLSSGAGVGAGLVLVGSLKGDVYALAEESGELRWQTKVTSEVLAAPQAAEGIVVVRSGDGKLFGLNSDSGERLWTYDRTVPALTLRGTSPPVLYEGLIIAGFDEGRLVAIELASGKPIWETRIAVASGRSELERMVDIDSAPVVEDGIIYVATFQGRLAAVDIESGRILWSREVPSHAGLSTDAANLYVSTDDHQVWALDRRTGTLIWKQEQLTGRAPTAPAEIGDYVVVGDLEGHLHWLSKADGQFAARAQLDESPIIAPPMALDRVVYVYSSDGALAAYTYQ
jgi:outer membrane protein assembly factor BamB